MCWLGRLNRSIRDVSSLDLSFEFFSLHAQYFCEALAFIGVLSLAEIETRVSIIKRRYFLYIGNANLANDFFLLFEELLRIDLWLRFSDWCRFWLCGRSLCGSWFRRILFLFLAFTFKLSELTQLFIFLSLLFRIYIGDNFLGWWPGCLRFDRLRFHLLSSSCSSSILRNTGIRIDVELLARLCCQFNLFFLLLHNFHAPFFFSLTGFNSKSDHLFLFSRELLFLFLVLPSLGLFFLSSNS